MNLIVPRRIQTEALESPLDRRFTKKMSQNSRQHETITRREESPNPYAAPRRIESLADCDIYHTIELPDHGLIEGQWDLREGIDDYLGGYDWKEQRVLELGPANGFVTSQLESRGAEVVACDLSEEHDWDVVPYAEDDVAGELEERRKHIRRLNNAWWLTHSQLNLNARVVYSPVYDVPESVGPVDAAFFGSILLHLRDPFRALQRAAALTTRAIVVTDLMPDPVQLYRNPIEKLLDRLRGRSNSIYTPRIAFLPRAKPREPKDTWWMISPESIREFLAILGFHDARVTRHRQRFAQLDRNMDFYTVVAFRE